MEPAQREPESKLVNGIVEGSKLLELDVECAVKPPNEDLGHSDEGQ